ncbi:MAG: TIM barrel protein [Lentisphaerae bacterium]|jgi:sugar phosphate isomerase/epimerase|nr:TIM barrel protein [Lentisphaerota bacterium]
MKNYKFGVADYGMNVWDGNLFDIEERLINLKEIGFNGTERLEAVSPSDAIFKATLYKKLGMDFTTCRGPKAQSGIEWTAALGKKYVWFDFAMSSRQVDFDVYCRRCNIMSKACARFGIKASVHNHMDQRVENQQELEDFLKAVPDAGIVFDTGHLSMAGGDPVEIIKKYHKRISVVHVKDVFLTGGTRADGVANYRFCELGKGNNGFNNADALLALRDSGWRGWIHVEQDDHLREPLIDLKTSLDFIKSVLS